MSCMWTARRRLCESWPVKPRIALLLAAFVASTAHAQLPAELLGNWVWPVENRSLLVFKLEAGPNGAAGTLQSPQQFTLSMSAASDNLTVSKILEPVATYKLTWLRETPDGHLLSYPREDGAVREFLLRSDGAGGAVMRFGVESGAPVGYLSRPQESLVVPSDWEPTRSYTALAPVPESSREMAEIFAADQVDRRVGPNEIDWKTVAPRDTARRARTRQLLEQGLLNSGDDYYYAAMVFQHGEVPADYLLAHVLAIAAQNRGRADANWIATATLDRYLQSIGQPQIMGTQFPYAPDGSVSQGEYDRALIPGALRPALGLPTPAQEEALRQRLQGVRPDASAEPAAR